MYMFTWSSGSRRPESCGWRQGHQEMRHW